MADYIDKVICGDCLEVMAQMPDESVDLILTDPPYGIAFMGKKWDKAVPPVDVWRECLRVLKPGAFAFIMCIPRQDCQSRMIVNLQDAGFDVSFSPMYHAFAQGFPKAMSISKAVDRRLGMEREVIGVYTTPEGRDYTKENTGKYGYNETDLSMGRHIGEERRMLTAPASPEAKALDGAYAGFQPKPAVEVVLVAMKPLSEKTYIDQALKNGKGVTWLGDCKIPYDITGESDNRIGTDALWGGKREASKHTVSMPAIDNMLMFKPNGRFPANIICGSAIDVDVEGLLEAKRILNENS